LSHSLALQPNAYSVRSAPASGSGSGPALEVMQPTVLQHNAFLAQELLPGVVVRHNEFVRIISGENEGATGSLVSVEELGNDPSFLLELESGYDVLVRQSQLARA
jgi:hypothetical protein